MNRTLIKNGHVVSMDPQLGNLPRADILVEEDRIVEIGPDLAVTDAQVIDADSCIVMPGLIDTHRHIWQGALRAVCADWSLLDYVRGIRMNAALAFTADDMYAAQYHGGLEAIDAGVTTVADYCHNLNTPDHAYESIRGLKESGLRTIWSYGFNRPPLEEHAFSSLDERLSFARKLAKEEFSDSSALVTMSVSPEETLFWGDDPARGVAQFELARELNVPLFWHCNSSTELNTGKRLRDVARLNELGLLGPDLVLVHLHSTDMDEWKMIADCGAGVSFTPDTELQMGMLWPSTVEAHTLGIPQSYGADITSNNSGDMFIALRMALQVARCRKLEQINGEQLKIGVPYTGEDALAWGTIEAARAIGLEDKIGSLTPGKQADLLLLRTDSLSMVGWDRSNPAGTIMSQCTARNVDTVMIAGKVVKQAGHMKADTAHACRLLEDAHEKVLSRIGGAEALLLDLGESDEKFASIAASADPGA